jgi:hypothetical protein
MLECGLLIPEVAGESSKQLAWHLHERGVEAFDGGDQDASGLE